MDDDRAQGRLHGELFGFLLLEVLVDRPGDLGERRDAGDDPDDRRHFGQAEAEVGGLVGRSDRLDSDFRSVRVGDALEIVDQRRTAVDLHHEVHWIGHGNPPTKDVHSEAVRK